jgi:Ser/Thr protein kinase RdoA (MazF antagonist)
MVIVCIADRKKYEVRGTHMRYSKELVLQGLQLFEIKDKIVNIEPFIEYFNFQENPSEVKFIAKIKFETKKPLIIRITKESHIDNSLAEKQSIFSEKMREYGINTPKRYSMNKKYVLEFSHEGHILNCALEDYVGSSIKKLNIEKLRDIGSLLGKMHLLSETNDIKLNTTGYVFNLLGVNEVIKLDKLVELHNQYNLDKKFLSRIQKSYNLILSKVSTKLESESKYGVQGDSSLSNLVFKNDKTWIFDYNIACDEYLVIQFVLEGLLLSYEEEYADNSTFDERFDSFTKGYFEERKLSAVEKEVFPLILKVSKALWFTKIQFNESSIEKLLKKSEFKLVYEILDNISKLLRD